MFKRNTISFSFAIIMMFVLAGVFSANAQQVTPPQGNSSVQKEIPQVELEDNELDNFVKAAEKVQELQAKSEKKMIKAIESEGLETQRFVEIIKLQNSGETEANVEVSEEELENFNKANSKVEKIQKDLQDKQVEAIESEGIKIERYVEIAQAARQNPELSQKIKDQLQKQ